MRSGPRLASRNPGLNRAGVGVVHLRTEVRSRDSARGDDQHAMQPSRSGRRPVDGEQASHCQRAGNRLRRVVLRVGEERRRVEHAVDVAVSCGGAVRDVDCPTRPAVGAPVVSLSRQLQG